MRITLGSYCRVSLCSGWKEEGTDAPSKSSAVLRILQQLAHLGASSCINRVVAKGLQLQYVLYLLYCNLLENGLHRKKGDWLHLTILPKYRTRYSFLTHPHPPPSKSSRHTLLHRIQLPYILPSYPQQSHAPSVGKPQHPVLVSSPVARHSLAHKAHAPVSRPLLYPPPGS